LRLRKILKCSLMGSPVYFEKYHVRPLSLPFDVGLKVLIVRSLGKNVEVLGVMNGPITEHSDFIIRGCKRGTKRCKPLRLGTLKMCG
jgi:hypothetical protein